MALHESISTRLSILTLLLANRPLRAGDCLDLTTEARAAAGRKEYARSAELYQEAVKTGARDPRVLYDAACAAALAGRKEQAFAFLEKALDEGLSGVATLKNDEDLVSLRLDARWAAALARAEANAAADKRFWANPVLAPPFAESLPEDVRIAGLSRMWWEVKLNFANFDLVPGLDWDAEYLAALPRARAARETIDYYRVLASTCAKLKDGHTNVIYPKELREKLLASPAIELSLAEGRVLIGTFPPDDPEITGLTAGDEIVTVDGEPVRSFADARIRPYQVASTPQSLEDATFRWALLHGAAGTAVSLGLRKADGTAKTVRLVRLAPDERRKRLPPPPEFELHRLAGGAIHLVLNTFGTPKAADEFEKALPGLLDAKALVFDVRSNSGGSGSVGWRILSHLIDAPAIVGYWRTRQYRPVYRAWGFPVESYGRDYTLAPSGDFSGRYRGPVAVLTSARTFSAAEDFTAAFRSLRRGKVVGETTAGSTGQPLLVPLPGGGSVRICSKRDTLGDGTEWVGKGLAPDVEVHPLVEDVRAGRDRVLERALELVK